MCCEKYDLSTIDMPKTVTSVSDMRDVLSHSCCSRCVGENNIKKETYQGTVGLNIGNSGGDIKAITRTITISV